MNERVKTIAKPIILALDTSSKVTSAAVSRGSQLLKSLRFEVAEKRSEMLWAEIESLLAAAGVTIRDVDVFSVCAGPGGFTGLRVGLAAMKGFASVQNKPMIGVTSLEAAARAARTSRTVCAMVNAYKGEVYWQLFSFDGDGVPVAQCEPQVSTFEKLIEAVEVKDVVFFADVDQSGEIGGNYAHGRSEGKWANRPTDYCPAEDIAQLAFLKYSRGETETAESLKACYVRPAEAEIKLSMGLLGSKIKRSMKSE